MKNWNEIPKQTLFRGEGEIGDCWRCCIAAILSLKAEEVPHFVQMSVDTESSPDSLTQIWLNARGYYIVMAENFRFYGPYDSEFEFPVLIACGPTPRSKQMHEHHAIVVDIYDNLLYDPHPDNTGLTAITEYYMIGKIL